MAIYLWLVSMRHKRMDPKWESANFVILTLIRRIFMRIYFRLCIRAEMCCQCGRDVRRQRQIRYAWNGILLIWNLILNKSIAHWLLLSHKVWFKLNRNVILHLVLLIDNRHTTNNHGLSYQRSRMMETNNCLWYQAFKFYR